MPCRNEDWVLGLTARAALMWCDELILWLHSCTDGSRDIAVAVAHEHPGRVIIDVANDPTWAEMSHREQMLELARERGATHIAMVDADEILTGNLIGAHILSLTIELSSVTLHASSSSRFTTCATASSSTTATACGVTASSPWPSPTTRRCTGRAIASIIVSQWVSDSLDLRRSTRETAA